MKSSMSPTLKRYIVTYDNGKSLKLFATNPMNALTLGSIVSDHIITDVTQAIVQMSINKINPN
jgi:hypothetical protein